MNSFNGAMASGPLLRALSANSAPRPKPLKETSMIFSRVCDSNSWLTGTTPSAIPIRWRMTVLDNHSPLETWRLIVIRGRGAEILVASDGVKCSLLEIEIPSQRRIAANINRIVERDFGLRVISLYEVLPCNPAFAAEAPYHAVVAIESVPVHRADTRWVYTRALTADSFSSAGEFAAVDALLTKLETTDRQVVTEPFVAPDWFTKAQKWIERSLRPHALHLTGEFRQLNASPTFSLIRFETTGSAVWFKAVGEPNLREWGVTLALSHTCPQFLPAILASKLTWHAWLSFDAAGESLVKQGGIHFWETAASSLANLQIQSVKHCELLLEAGARDLRLEKLFPQVDPFFQFAADCTGRAPLQSSDNLSLLELIDLKEVIQAGFDQIESLHLVDSVGHMDLNPSNIFCTSDRAIFLDWAEGFVGNPLFSFEYMLQHFRQSLPGEPSLEERFRKAYLKSLRGFVPPEHLKQILSLLPVVALFAYAVTVWSSSQHDSAWTARWQRYLLKLVRKMNGYATHREAEGVRP